MVWCEQAAISKGAGEDTEEIELYRRTQHGAIIEPSGQNVVHQRNQHPEHVNLAGGEQQQRGDEVHALAVANVGVVDAVSR